MTQTLKTSERLGVVDALRGFALLAIVLLHNLEHYNLFLVPENVPAWLQIIDKYAWDILFFLFAGKAYATFSLLFGFSFYIQFHNAEKRGIDFRGRRWRGPGAAGNPCGRRGALRPHVAAGGLEHPDGG